MTAELIAYLGIGKGDAASSQRLPVGNTEESLRLYQRQLLADSSKRRAGWAGGPDSCCVLPVS